MSDNMFKGCEDGMAGTISGFSDGFAVGEIIGSSNVADITRLPVVITGHSGFGAANDPAELKQDNTVDNIIHSINYGPEFIEVDVRRYDADGDGIAEEFRIGHNASHAVNGATLKSVIELLAGDHPRSSELDPEYANSVRIQLDVKEDGIIDELFQLIDELQFPYSRICLAGNNSYAHVEENIEKIRARVDQGMDFWMNPNYILSYDAMANDTDAFIERIKALNVSSFTVNSDYRHMTEQIQRKLEDAGIQVSVWTLNSASTIQSFILRGVYNLTTRMQEALVIREQILKSGTLASSLTSSDLHETGSGTTSER